MKDLQKQSQPGFDWTFISNAQGTCIEVADHYDNQGNEDASTSKEYEKADSSNSNAEEVSGDDDYYEQKEPDSMVIEVADAEFYDFDWYKSEECFAVDQIWAIYDCLDVMPRFYARIDKVYSPFKVDVTRLEYVAGDIDETAWERSGLPVACGKFKLGTTDTIDNVLPFSHKIFKEKSIDESYTIYPQKGETWALYKNWSSADPDNHIEYEYEFVLVLSDYSKESGIFVAHLVKLKGFGSFIYNDR
ncbi:hypothetical protein MKX03_002716 [Papaver bracteatum]|nr:hypothetical protein MKX03_002716 [Papaver bracteatum]